MEQDRNLRIEYIQLVYEYCMGLREGFFDGTMGISEIQSGTRDMQEFVQNLRGMLFPYEYESQREVFDTFYDMCGACSDMNFLQTNLELFFSVLELFTHSVKTICDRYKDNKRQCSCCGTEVMYSPLPEYYSEMLKRYGAQMHQAETLNREEYLCPVCGSSDRDRMIISFLQKAGLPQAEEHTKVLQIAPSTTIETWIQTHCPHVDYETTDLYMEGVTFQSDITDMYMVGDETYDLVICSHVLEHVQDDKKAMREMIRILKPNGLVVFLVPVSLDIEGIDEEWGLSEEKNWKRFGQGDHCRRYGKKGLMKRLEEQGFFVNALGKDYFGEGVFEQLSLTDTSTLYVLTKDKSVKLDLSWDYTVDEKLLTDGPLVSVILPAYNHEEFVADAIESVLNQTYKNIEFLVADDASTDHTAEIMKRYSEHFAEEFYFTENAGARGRFLRSRATGKYIALASSDDFWEPDKLALQVDYLEKHENVAACFTWCNYVDENKKELNDNIFIQKNRNRYEWMSYFWENGNVLCHPSILIRREEYLRLINIGNACRQLPDLFMWIDLVQRADIYIIPKVLVKMTRFINEKNENTSAITMKNIRRHMIEENGCWNSVIRKMDASYFSIAFRDKMRNPEVKDETEIMCEKFFLMLGSDKWWLQANAIQYFLEVFDDEAVRECFVHKYSFTVKKFWKVMLEKGWPVGVED